MTREHTVGNGQRPPASARELERLNRLYAMLSGVNRTIVRVDDAQTLFDEACRVAVEEGGFTAAWVSLLEPGCSSLRVVARAGSANPSACGCCPEQAACPLRQGLPCRIDDLAVDPRAAAWRGNAPDRGLRAVIALPLRQGGQLLGAFGVGSRVANAFAAADLAMLDEVANDLSFALEVQHREQARIADQSRIEFLAYYDAHTGLPNRAMCERRLREASVGGGHLAVLVVELGVFHEVARVLGPGAAVLLAREVAQRLEQRLPYAGVARIAENSFAVWLPGLPGGDAARQAAEDAAQHIGATLAPVVRVDGQDLFVAPFVGVALHPEDGGVDDVLKHAVVAVARGRDQGDLGYRFFAEEMARSSRRSFDLDAALRRAVDNAEFRVYYQPQVDLVSGEVSGAEALLRWHRPDVGLVSPLEFIPALESSGLISVVGEWVLEEACRQCQGWQDLRAQPLRVGVNLSARQFHDGDVRAAARRAVARSGLDPHLLELELTESIVLQDADGVIRNLRELRGEGIGTALDDFGTGYSSLSYLQRLPVDRIKIDRSFVTDLTSNPNSAAIARAIIGMTHSLGMTVVAEGVETEGQLGYLRGLGCEEMQGYLFSPPLNGDAFRALLGEGRRLGAEDEAVRGERVMLVVDDEVNVLNALCRVFRRERVRVLTAASPREGFELLANYAVGVVISDQRMPGMSGTEFLRRVKALYPDVVRIVLSGYTDLGTVLEAVNHGSIYKFVTKPWDDTGLREIVGEAFALFEMARQNRALSERLANLLGPAPVPSGEPRAPGWPN